MKDQFPPIPEALVTELEKRFPPFYPSLAQNERELWMKGGEGRIIQFLRHKFNEQQGDRIRRKPNV
ncbi:hypothetical protein [Brucella sp. 10RB9213]|uniref:hypothetical protein n=1 Tax=Brucella sp. 10RB9213 TaxID=1844039 RepID=UPI0012AE71F1|nr:hypothetical protein [Brucella sp. 10RB9213]MRN66397.1 hypothetical protein [Brucella sp. 10RB9213]